MMTSLNTKVKQILGLQDTSDLNPWENGFVESVAEITKDGERTTGLSDKQVEVVERIWSKHFA
jgi:hypothetical protein